MVALGFSVSVTNDSTASHQFGPSHAFLHGNCNVTLSSMNRCVHHAILSQINDKLKQCFSHRVCLFFFWTKRKERTCVLWYKISECFCVSSGRREYRSRSVQPQSQRPPVSSQSGPIVDSGSSHGLVQRLSNSQLSFNTSIASIFSQVSAHILRQSASFTRSFLKGWSGCFCVFRFHISQEQEGSAHSSRQRSISSDPARCEPATLPHNWDLALPCITLSFVPFWCLPPGFVIFFHAQPPLREAKFLQRPGHLWAVCRWRGQHHRHAVLIQRQHRHGAFTQVQQQSHTGRTQNMRPSPPSYSTRCSLKWSSPSESQNLVWFIWNGSWPLLTFFFSGHQSHMRPLTRRTPTSLLRWETARRRVTGAATRI